MPQHVGADCHLGLPAGKDPLLQDTQRLETLLRNLPAEPGCYLMRDRDDRILYIGKSKKLRSRVRSYFRDGHPISPRIRLMVRQVVDIEFIVTDSEAEALALEEASRFLSKLFAACNVTPLAYKEPLGKRQKLF